jgi:hypothetical protein
MGDEVDDHFVCCLTKCANLLVWPASRSKMISRPELVLVYICNASHSKNLEFGSAHIFQIRSAFLVRICGALDKLLAVGKGV